MKHWPLRFQLWMFLFVVLIPLLGLLTQTALLEASTSIERVSEQNLGMAELMANSIESFVAEQRKHLDAIAQRPDIRRMEASACDPLLLDFPSLHPVYYAISVLDLNGVIVCSSHPSILQPGTSVADLPYFQAFQRAGTYMIGEILTEPSANGLVVGQFFPIHNAQGELVGVLAAPLLVKQFGGIIENSHLPAATTATLIHDNGTVLARSVDAERWVGYNGQDLPIVKTVLSAPSGWVKAEGISGVERLYGFSHIEDTPWHIYIGTEMSLVYASTRHLLTYTLSWGLLLIGLVLICALVIERNIEQPIRSLANTTRAIASGDRTQRAAVSGPKEIANVAASFNSMLYALETANQTLHESESRFRLVLENSQDAMYRMDLRSFRYDYISPAIEAILGYSTDAICSFSDVERVAYLHPDDRERALTTFAEALQGNASSYYLEYRCIHKDGHTIWLGDKFSVQYDDEGTPRFLVGAQRDITQQKADADELHAYEERLRVIIEASPDLIILVDEEGKNLEILSQKSDMLSRAIAEVSGKSLAEVSPPDEKALFMGIIERALSLPETDSIGFPLNIEGRSFWLEARSARLNLRKDGKRLLLFVVRDATQRKAAEEELRKFTRAIEQSPASVVITNTAGKIEYVNPRFCQVTGYSQAEVLGENPRLLKSGYQASEYYAEMWHQITEGHEWRGELCNRKKDGELFWEQASISPIKNEAGEVTHYIAIKEDISERKRIEDQLRQQDRLAAVGQLAAGIAHDFNNIMSAIILYARMLEQHANLTEKEKTRLNVINDQAQHAVNLIRQILDFSRRSLVERGPVDLVPFFKEMVKMWERTFPESIRVEFVYDANRYIVNADPTRLQQAMLNLALNARDAMPNGGTLQLALQAEQLAPGQTPPIPGMQTGGWLCILCRDNGVGIEPNILPRIFDPFFTTKDPGKGTGLGLAQVYGIVGQHDGFIDVRSDSETGTTFRIYLPLQEEMEPIHMSDTTQNPRTGHEMILLVEDNSVSRGAIQDILDLQGYQVLCAHNGVEALDIYQERADEIDLVLSDMIMPEMSGQQLYQALKAYDPAVKMVLMTGYPLEEEGRKLLEQGLFAWLQKPFTIEALSDVLTTALDQPVVQPRSLQV